MKYTIKLIIRILLLPIPIIVLAGTAAICFTTDSDWDYWKLFNQGMISMLPFNEMFK